MKKIYYTLFVCLMGLLTFSCSEDTDPIHNSEDTTPSTLNAINDSYTLEATNSQFATFKFTATNFGISTSILYALEASLDNNFGSVSELGSATDVDSGIEIAAEKMNSAMLGWDAVPETPVTVYFRIKAYVQNLSSKPTAMVAYSNVISSTISPYSGEREYPKVWVIGDYCGWSHDATQFLFCFEEDDKNYQGMVDFGEKAASGFKITGIAGWQDDCNWGTDSSAAAPEAEALTVQLISSGGSGNISCYSKRFYHLSFDKTSLVLKKGNSFTTLSIIGDAGAQVSGWGTAEVDMNFDTAKQRFWADVEFAEGEVKFRVDHDWGTSFGSATEGKLDSGDNIKVPAGKYRVYVNMNNANDMTYELNEKDFGK